MANASTYTCLSLDRFAQLVGLHPLHFNQVEVRLPDGGAIDECGMPIVQYSWQAGERLGREEIAMAISDAESDMERYLGFSVGPRWITQESVRVPRPQKPELFNGLAMDARAMYLGLKTELGYVESGGQEAVTLLHAAAPVLYTDLDGDGYKETATIVASGLPGSTVAQEVGIWYPGTGGTPGDNMWEVRPCKVTVLPDLYGGTVTATIVARREQFLASDFMMGLLPRAQDGLDDANFLATVDIYRHWTDPQKQALFAWERVPFSGMWGYMTGVLGCNDCGTTGCPQCASYEAWGCIETRDKRNGIIAIHPFTTWNVALGQFDNLTSSGISMVWRTPDRLLLNYRAGYPRPSNGLVDGRFERAVAYLALANLDRLLCNCNMLKALVSHWQEDLAQQVLSSGSGSSFKLSPNTLGNPFGTTRAGINAWSSIFPELKGEAVIA